jgi:predicted GIY-YIG superfamily endonuclease
MTAVSERNTVLYRHLDADGALLYVGITCDPVNRLSNHKACSPWAASIASVTMQWFDCREDAAAAERIAVRDERPAYNREFAIRTGNPIEWLVSHWGSRKALAEIIGAETIAVHRWAQRSRIPSDWQAAVVEAAQDAGMGEIDAAWMLAAHDRRISPTPTEARA